MEHQFYEDSGGDEKLFVQFEMRPVKNEQKSLEAGRPIFDDVEYIRIVIPGDKTMENHRPVWNDPNHPKSDVNRFARRYHAWKAGQNQEAVSGTPLDLLANLASPILSHAQVEEFKYFKIRTVEQLVAIPDSIAQKFMGIHEIRRKAQSFLDAAASNAPTEQLRTELDKRDNEIAALKQMLKEQGEQISKIEKRK